MALAMDFSDYPNKNCDNCEFNVGPVCAASDTNPETGENMYGCPIDEAKRLFPNGCADWELSFTVSSTTSIR